MNLEYILRDNKLTQGKHTMNKNAQCRCPWLDTSKQDYVAYHDEEWGVPLYDDQKLFELITLESAQAGLSWYTILKKRSGYRHAFENFDVKKVGRRKDNSIISRKLTSKQLGLGVRLLYVDVDTKRVELHPNQFAIKPFSESDLTTSLLLRSMKHSQG